MNAVLVILIAGAAAIASLIGGLVALWRKPTTLFMSSVLGFASGVLHLLLRTTCAGTLACRR